MPALCYYISRIKVKRFLTMYRKLLLISLTLLGTLPGWAQNETDVLRYSQYGLTGSARALGMGGAFSAVGADVTSASVNAAGLGLYRSSSLVISPAVFSPTTTANYLDKSNVSSITKIGLPSIGVVLFGEKQDFLNNEYADASQGLKSYTFSFGYNQKQNYNRNLGISAYNEFSSVTNMFADQANGTFPQNLASNSFAQLAWDAYAIDTIRGQDGKTYFPAVNDGRVQQSINFNESGRTNEWYLALAGNYEDFIYFGGRVGIEAVNYTQNFQIKETDINNLHHVYDPYPKEVNGFPLEFPMNSVTFSQTFQTKGTGVNGQLGIIVRASDQLRLGLSVQTPTYYSLSDSYSAEVSQNYNVDDNTTTDASGSTGQLNYDYNLVTPYKATLGSVFFLGKVGFISADLDYTDYSSGSLRSSSGFNDYFQEPNSQVLRLYKSAVNLRIGTELRKDIFRVRGGFAYYGSPYTDLASKYLENDLTTIGTASAVRRFITFGLGIRQPNYFVDVSLVNQHQNDKFSPYTVSDDTIFVPTVTSAKNGNQIMLTMGFNFE